MRYSQTRRVPAAFSFKDKVSVLGSGYRGFRMVARSRGRAVGISISLPNVTHSVRRSSGEAPGPTIVLGGRAFFYVDQDWSAFAGIIDAVAEETRLALALFSFHLALSIPLFEGGSLLTPADLRQRCVDLTTGLQYLHRDTLVH